MKARIGDTIRVTEPSDWLSFGDYEAGFTATVIGESPGGNALVDWDQPSPNPKDHDRCTLLFDEEYEVTGHKDLTPEQVAMGKEHTDDIRRDNGPLLASLGIPY